MALRDTVGVVHGELVDSESLGAVDGHQLDWRVLEGKVLDGGFRERMGVEELRLRLASVGSLSVPPSSTISVNYRARGASDSNGSSGNRNQRTGPFLVTEGSSSFEDNLAF